MSPRRISSDYFETENRRSGIYAVPWGGNFRKVGGSRMVGRRIFRNRVIVFLLALLVFGTGVTCIFF